MRALKAEVTVETQALSLPHPSPQIREGPLHEASGAQEEPEVLLDSCLQSPSPVVCSWNLTVSLHCHPVLAVISSLLNPEAAPTLACLPVSLVSSSHSTEIF